MGVQLVSPVQLVSVVQLERLASMARKARQVLRVSLDLQEHPVARVLVDLREARELVWPDLQAVPDLAVFLVFKVLLVVADLRVLLELLVQTARRVQRVTVVNLSCRFTSTLSKAMWT